ncbi:BatD family protein [Photobacterium makurazakiensis]|uniref:BatD family protein n=1 Tax=Photobacterium makurazakiensis TaxID=2910234 RepID=UPI003D13B89B
MIKALINQRRPLRHQKVNTLLSYFMFLLFFVFTSSSHAAQAVATVSKNVVGVNEVFQLKVSVDDNVNTSSLDLTVLDENFNYGTPSVSSGTSYNNGVVSRNTEWTVALAAKEIGEWTIPSFRIGASQTDPIAITSLKSASNNTDNDTSKPDIHIDYNIDKDSLYIGESIRYTVRIRIGEQLSQPSLIAPSGEGLDVRQDGDDHQAETILNGKRYIIITRDYQITAKKPGDILLRGAEFKGSVIKGSRGFGSTLRVPVDLQIQDVTIEVKDKPEDYKGLWLPTEDLVLEQHWQPETNEIKVGEPISRTIMLRIKNAEQSTLPNLTLNYPSNVRVYDEKPIYGSDAGYTTMTIKQVIIARTEGNITLPPLTINWWNTSTSKQERSHIDGLELTVLPGDVASTSLPVQPSPEITPVTQESTKQPLITEEKYNWWPWLSLVLFAFWLATIKLWLNERKKQPKSAGVEAQRRSKALTPIEGMLQAAKSNQPIQLQAYFEQWRGMNPDHPSTKPLKASIDGYMQQRYAKSNEGAGSTEALIEQLDALEKHNNTHNNAQSGALAPIIPNT